jgi:hypothetical protein
VTTPSTSTVGISRPAGSALVAAWRSRSGGRGARLQSAPSADWPSRTLRAAPAIQAAIASGVRVRIVDRPGAAQTELRVGHAGVARTHPDRAVLRLLNSLLGGKFTSRINLNLRERHGYTYGAFSRFADRRGAGPVHRLLRGRHRARRRRRAGDSARS